MVGTSFRLEGGWEKGIWGEVFGGFYIACLWHDGK